MAGGLARTPQLAFSRRRTGLLALVLVFSIPAGQSAASVLGPVQAEGFPHQVYLGAVRDGETDYIGCTLLHCPAVEVCNLDEARLKIVLRNLGSRTDLLLLRALDDGVLREQLAAGTLGFAAMEAAQRDSCYQVWVVGLRVEAVASYALEIDVLQSSGGRVYAEAATAAMTASTTTPTTPTTA